MGEAFKYRAYAPTPVSTPEDMASRLMQFAPASDSEALKLLRARFPDCPLSARVAALGYLMRRRADATAAS